MKLKSICEKINILDISADGLLTSFDLKYSYCYELNGIDIALMSPIEQEKINERICGFLTNIEEGITLQLFTRVTYGNSELITQLEKKIGSHTDEKYKFLADDSLEHLKKLPQRKHSLYLFVTYDNKYKTQPVYLLPRLFNNIESYELNKNKQKSIEVLSLFESSTLPLLGLRVNRLKDQETFSLLFNYINKEKSLFLKPEMYKTEQDEGSPGLYQSLPYLKNFTIRDQLVRSAIDNTSPHYIQIDGQYYITVNLALLPKSVSPDTMLAMLSPKFEFDMSFQITAPNEEKFISQLNFIRTILRSSDVLKTKQFQNNIVQDSQKYEIAETKNALNLIEDKAFEIRILYVLSDSNLKKCINKARTIEAMGQTQEGMQLIKDNYCHLNNFFSLLPGAYLLNERKSGILSKNLSKLFPIAQNWQGTKDVQLLLQNSQRELLPLSYKTEQQGMSVPNTLVAGQPGEGKSWFTNYLIKALLVYNPKTFINIIDNGGSYKKLYSLFKDRSTYIEMGYREECAFNYFSEKKIVTESDETFGKYKTYIGNLIALTVQNETDKEYSESQKYIIEKGINALYDSIQDNEIPLLEQFQDIARKITPRNEDDERFITQLVNNLDMYTDPKSSKSVIFNRRSTISLDKQMLFVDIQNIDQDPKFQAIYNFMINQQMRDRMINFPDWKQIIVFDEVWKAWKTARSKEFQEEVGRKGRKNDTSIILLSQFIKDYTDKSIAVIRNACPIHFIFKTEDTDLLLKDPFSYNENKVKAIHSMQGEKGKSSQFFIKWGLDSSIAHIEGSKIDSVISSTDAITRLKYSEFYDNPNADMFELLKKIKSDNP